MSLEAQRSYAEFLRRSSRLADLSPALAERADLVLRTYRDALAVAGCPDHDAWVQFAGAARALVVETQRYHIIGALRQREQDDLTFFAGIVAENADLLTAQAVAA